MIWFEEKWLSFSGTGRGRRIAALCLMLGVSCLWAQPAALERLELLATIELQGATHHVQGIAVEGSRLLVTSVERGARKGWLLEFELPAGRLVRSLAVERGERYHPGGIATADGSLWLPIAEYRRGGRSTIERRDLASLAVRASFEVDDHIGCLAVERGRLHGGNWDALRIYTWDLEGRQLGVRDNPTDNRFQDMKAIGGVLVGSGNLPGGGGAVDWIELPGWRPLRRLAAGLTSRGVPHTHEGMAIVNGRLYLLPEDEPSRLFVFRLDSDMPTP